MSLSREQRQWQRASRHVSRTSWITSGPANVHPLFGRCARCSASVHRTECKATCDHFRGRASSSGTPDSAEPCELLNLIVRQLLWLTAARLNSSLWCKWNHQHIHFSRNYSTNSVDVSKHRCQSGNISKTGRADRPTKTRSATRGSRRLASTGTWLAHVGQYATHHNRRSNPLN